ncbi:hypothetical protein ACN6MT_11245 [Neobacillus niacini]|uniref:hypothetical protein n=1 Tax=Neobacillus niacini TaxID=86668 RepID=UPI003B027616
MSQLTQLALAYKIGKEQKLPTGIDNFINACVIENKFELIKAIDVLNDYSSIYIVESFVCTILKGIFLEKSREDMLNTIAGGSIFKIYQKLFDSFLNDEDIKQVIEGGNVYEQIR